jgi:hypothetical protein
MLPKLAAGMASLKLITEGLTMAKMKNFLMTQRQTLAEVKHRAAMIASTVASGAMAAKTAVVNAMMSTSIARHIAAAAAKIFSAHAGIPFVGIAIAAAFVATMTAAMFALKGKFARFAKGGLIEEPTMLMGLRTGSLGIAGEAGHEYIVPAGEIVKAMTTNITNQFYIQRIIIREEADIQKVAVALEDLQGRKNRAVGK